MAAGLAWAYVVNGTLAGDTESMEYIGRVPGPPLDRFIDDLYCLTGVPRHRRMNVPPMPSAHLLVNLGGPVLLWDSGPPGPPAACADGWFMGVWTRRFLFEYPERVRVAGVHFKPWGLSPFAGVPAAGCGTGGCRPTPSGTGRWTGSATRLARPHRPPGHCG